MDHNVNAACHLVEAQEASGEAACYRAAAAHGIEPNKADQCEDRQFGCPLCPWRVRLGALCFRYTVRGGVLAITDQNRGICARDHMPAVLRRITNDLGSLAALAVMYRDSEGIWDGVRVIYGQFGYFFAINETSEELARSKLLHMEGE